LKKSRILFNFIQLFIPTKHTKHVSIFCWNRVFWYVSNLSHRTTPTTIITHNRWWGQVKGNLRTSYWSNINLWGAWVWTQKSSLILVGYFFFFFQVQKRRRIKYCQWASLSLLIFKADRKWELSRIYTFKHKVGSGPFSNREYFHGRIIEHDLSNNKII